MHYNVNSRLKRIDFKTVRIVYKLDDRKSSNLKKSKKIYCSCTLYVMQEKKIVLNPDEKNIVNDKTLKTITI